MTDIKTESIKVGDYSFFKNGLVRLPDGDLIDGKKINPMGISIMPNGREDKPWSVILITEASLYKYRSKITENLELVGYHFRTLDDATIVVNILSAYYFVRERNILDGPDTENNE
jgi:hypothetical protein